MMEIEETGEPSCSDEVRFHFYFISEGADENYSSEKRVARWEVKRLESK